MQNDNYKKRKVGLIFLALVLGIVCVFLVGVVSSICGGFIQDGICYEIGDELRVNGTYYYVDVYGNLQEQKEDGAGCQNSFECLNNLCSNGVCVDVYEEVEENSGLIKDIENKSQEIEFCGNGVCEAEFGENFETCPEDCIVCEDTDNGKNYFSKGIVTLDTESSEDYCVDSGKVMEYFCGDGIEQEEHECPAGCEDGKCVIPVGNNVKDMAKYGDKEVFLISDKNWKDILPLVPVTTWTGDEDCKRGTGTPENVCVYPSLIFHEELEEICDNGVDDNENGLVDCCDPYCADAPICQEVCGDGIDNDCDGDIDCADYDCRYDENCIESICDDGIDNDGDGDIDCADYDCRYDPRCGYDIFMYDISTGEETVITNADYDQRYPAVWGDRIVWNDNRNSYYREIYMYDISTGEERLVSSGGSANYRPDIYEDKIVWVEWDNGYSVNIYDISTGETISITDDEEGYDVGAPSIYGDRVVWVQRSYDSVSGWLYEIYMHDISTGEERLVSSGTSYISSECEIQGDRVVWEEISFSGWLYEIYMHDISTGEETVISSGEDHQRYPAVWGDRIVWSSKGGGQSDSSFGMNSLSQEETYAPYFDPVHGKNLIRVYFEDDLSPLLKYDIASVSENYVDVVATGTEMGELNRAGYNFEILPMNTFDFFGDDYSGSQYHSYDSMVSELQSIEENYPSLPNPNKFLLIFNPLKKTKPPVIPASNGYLLT
jgi:beta propeller repeat protein